MAFLRRIPLYVKVWTNRMELIHLDDGRSLIMESRRPFSNERIVFAHFFEAEEHLKWMIDELLGKKRFRPAFRIVVQQMERCEGGLSAVEKRALKDSCEHAGAVVVKLVEHDRALTPAEALAVLSAP